METNNLHFTIINWNILAECMRRFLKLDPADLSAEKRRSMICTTLEALIAANPSALVALQEVSLAELPAVSAVLTKAGYLIVRGNPSDYSPDLDFWRYTRQEMSVLLAIPPLLQTYIAASEVVDLVKQLPPQDASVVFPNFKDAKGTTLEHSTADELLKRTSLAAFVVLNIDSRKYVVVTNHDPCVFYMPEFQALVGECKKNFAQKFEADAVIFVGDSNITKGNQLFDSFVHGVPCAALLPPAFVGVTLNPLAASDCTDITNWNGDFCSDLCHVVVFGHKDMHAKVVKNLPVGPMTSSGPNMDFPSAHVPVLFDVFL